MRILFIENDDILGSVLKRYLINDGGYTVDWLENNKTAEAILNMNNHYDIAIVDLALPRISWEAWFKTFKNKNSTTPILILSPRIYGADKDLKRLNADGHIYKHTLSKEELLANIRILLRPKFPELKNAAMLNFKHITLDLDRQEILVNGEKIDYARREYTLLHKLLTHIGETVTYEDLLQDMDGEVLRTRANTLDTDITYLQKKLKIDFIKTVQGMGYTIPKDLD